MGICLEKNWSIDPPAGFHVLADRRRRILVVDEDGRLQRLLEVHLDLRHFRVKGVRADGDVMAAASSDQPHLILLDVGLRSASSLLLFGELRSRSTAPVILADTGELLGARKDRQLSDQGALGSGSADVLTRLLELRRLLSRIHAALGAWPGTRKNDSPISDLFQEGGLIEQCQVWDLQPQQCGQENRQEDQDSAAVRQMPVLQVGDLRIDGERLRVYRGEEILHLSVTEARLLYELASFPNVVLTYRHLAQSVWGQDGEDTRLLHLAIFYLRRKLEQTTTGRRYIVSAPGIGFSFRIPSGVPSCSRKVTLS